MRMTTKASILALCLSLFAQDAMAWGPRAHQAVALAALQLARRQVPDAFMAGDVNYEINLLQGAADGVGVVGDVVPLYNDAQTVDAVGSEIQLLREARVRGAGSHFAYRMGVLSALVCDVILPHGFAFDEEEAALQEKIRADLETHLNVYSYSPSKRTYHYVRSPRLYFEAKRPFYQDDRQLITNEYARDTNYDGFLRQAAPIYFERAINAVVDVWYTVFKEEGAITDVKPSSRQLSLYYINEIGYLLDVMESMEYAERAYQIFREVNPDFARAYIDIGDLFYAFDTEESRLRAVKEWQIAQIVPGETRRLASQRLGEHFIGEGERLYALGDSVDALESDFPDALRAFESALEYDRTNNYAATQINRTSEAIRIRREKYDLQQRFLDYALKTIKEAERSRFDNDFVGAFTSYNQAAGLVELVTTDFKNIYASARETSSTIKKDIKSVIKQVLDTANNSIEDGDTEMLNSNFDEAIRYYNMVPAIVDVIPAEPGSIDEGFKQDLVDTAVGSIRDAQLGKKRQEEAAALRANPPKKGLFGGDEDN